MPPFLTVSDNMNGNEINNQYDYPLKVAVTDGLMEQTYKIRGRVMATKSTGGQFYTIMQIGDLIYEVDKMHKKKDNGRIEKLRLRWENENPPNTPSSSNPPPPPSLSKETLLEPSPASTPTTSTQSIPLHPPSLLKERTLEPHSPSAPPPPPSLSKKAIPPPTPSKQKRSSRATTKKFLRRKKVSERILAQNKKRRIIR
ncbi:hypothetical protein BCR42DRAFT_398736 [Absidia repens]|uniref:Uncharacterized protein n=1 Tax=Absidia repens TaxID=90262 RepID=A0A1X2HXA3_9FUNG|nr:hypothetical protein BCR42DRAFT_398736 [Absidia repens]